MIVKFIICSKKHFTIMCPTLSEKERHTVNNEDYLNKNKSKECTNLTSQSYSRQVLLQTLTINVEASNQTRSVRALLDSG